MIEQKLFKISYKSHKFYEDFDSSESLNSLICFEEGLDEALTFIWDNMYSYMNHSHELHKEQYKVGLAELLKFKSYDNKPTSGAETLWVEVEEVSFFKSTKHE